MEEAAAGELAEEGDTFEDEEEEAPEIDSGDEETLALMLEVSRPGLTNTKVSAEPRAEEQQATSQAPVEEVRRQLRALPASFGKADAVVEQPGGTCDALSAANRSEQASGSSGIATGTSSSSRSRAIAELP